MPEASSFKPERSVKLTNQAATPDTVGVIKYRMTDLRWAIYMDSGRAMFLREDQIVGWSFFGVARYDGRNIGGKGDETPSA